jgi:hypothetical protein
VRIYEGIGFFLSAAVAGVILLGGCNENASPQDGGASDVHLYRLGSGRYVVNDVMVGVDECNLGITTGAVYDLVVDNATGRASLTEAGSGPGCTAGLGCGTISANQGVLTNDIPPTPQGGCSKRKMVSSTISLIADMTFQLRVDYQEMDRVGCSNPSDSTCVSRYTLNLVLQSSVAGTNGN